MQRFRVFFKPFGKRSRQLRILEVNVNQPQEAYSEILQTYPLAEIAGVFAIENKKGAKAI
jgi:hypothetical protein